MVQFNEDFRFSHATLSADRRLFNTLFGITRQDYCSLFPDAYNYNDELCWEELIDDKSVSGWIATIPTAEEIAANSGHSFNDCQPRYPWRHVDECPVEVEPYPMCLKLLRKAGSAVLVTPGLLPYCGGLDRYGAFSQPEALLKLAKCGRNGWKNQYDEVCRKKTDTRLAVGYGLDEEGTWYPEAWFVRRDGVVLSANPRAQYYGVLLSEAAGARFLRRYAAAKREGLELPQW